jgi:hypothetical protein
MAAARSRSPSSKEIVDKALPARELALQRGQLVMTIVDFIDGYRDFVTRVEPSRKNVREQRDIVGSLKNAVSKATYKLQRLGLGKVMRTYGDRLVPMAGAAAVPPGAPSALIELASILVDTEQRIADWEQQYKPHIGRPREPSAQLTAHIRYYAERAELTRAETDKLLAAISEIEGLPTLTADTLNKRKTRADKLAKK